MRVTATEAALSVVRKIAVQGRGDLVMVLGTGCCDSTAPYLYDHYYPGPDAVRVRDIDGVPIHAPRFLADLYGEGEGLQINVEEGVTDDSFSLESDLDCRFVLRAPRAGTRNEGLAAG
jgi:uncharacterized protein (DUF779 family)